MKKMLSVILVTLLALMLTGCNNNASGISTTPAPIKPAATTPVQTTPAPTTPPAPTEPVDEIALLRTTFEIAEKDQGVFLVRDDKIYTLNNRGSKVPGVNYNPFQIMKNGSVIFYLHYANRSLNGYNSVMGEVPIPVLTEGDKIIAFSDKFCDLELAPANLLGYSFIISKADGEYGWYDENGIYFSTTKKNFEFTISDENGNVVKDYFSLEKDGAYTLSWYEGTKYNESRLKANCLQFDYNYQNKSDHLFVSGTLTKSGYAEYDLSGIPAGLYVIKLNDRSTMCGGLIEIK